MKKFVLSAVTILTMGFGWACGGDDEKAAGVEVPTHVGETASGAVTAAAGGEVALASAAAKINIPAGALPADTTITVDVVAATGTPTPTGEDLLASDVFEFGPSGTTFTTPVTMSLKLEATGLPEGDAKLAWLDEDANKWVQVPGSKLVDGFVVGDVNHFSKFVIYFVGDVAIIDTTDKACKELNFAACGGDLVGTWSITNLCIENAVVAENPWGEMPGCASSVYEINMDMQGYITFVQDGTYTQEFNESVTIHIELSAECLNGMGGQYSGAEVICDTIGTQMADENGSCEYTGGKCVCDFAPQDEGTDDPKTGTWSVTGNNLMIDDAADDNPNGMPFCVAGSVCVVETNMGGDAQSTTPAHIILEKN